MKAFLIVANGLKDNTKECVDQLTAFLNQEKVGFHIVWIQYSTNLMEEMHGKDLSGYEAAIVIGGDGTLIRASRALKEHMMPLIGVNVGNIGYLCEVDREHIIPSMRRILNGEYTLEKRMLLRGKTVDTQQDALNEIAIYRGGKLCIVLLELYVNGQYLTTYRGDGLVIATPTGSTGYNMSCGGPIVNPASSMILVTPIAPHSTTSSRSIVLEDSSEIEIRPVHRDGQQDPEEILVSFDGADTRSLTEPIRIWKSDNETLLVKLTQNSFLETLKQKL